MHVFCIINRTVSYIPKTDNHLATLKVGETLLFSAKMRSPAHMEEAHLQKSVDTVLGWLGLTEEHKNTFVGDANLKGISGGQKRRLSIGVEVVSGFSICIAELPTNGLDAKTAFEVVNSARTVAKTGDKSMIMSLAQPSPELFDLFDNCCLLAMGECIYFGPQSQVQMYLQQQCKLIQPQNKSLPAWIEELTVKPSKFISDSLRNEIISSQSVKNSNLLISDRQIIRYLAKKFRNSKYFADLSKEVLWRHLDLIHADTKCKKIPEEPTTQNNNDNNNDNDADPSIDDEHDSKQQTTNTNDKKGEIDDLENTVNSVSMSTGGLGSIAMQLHRKTTDKFMSSSIVSGLEMLNTDKNRSSSFDEHGHYKHYEKTYDLRGLEHGFVWSLPRLPSPMFQIAEICKRRFLATSRNKPLIFSRLLQALVAAICLGSLFWQLKTTGEKNMVPRVGVLFFIVGFMGFGAVPFIPSLSTQLPVFYYQKQSGYFKVYCFYIAQIIAEFPFTFIESAIFATISYWMIGLIPSLTKFAAFFIITFLVRFTSWSFCMAITGAVGNASVAQSIATVILPFWYAFNGFLVPAWDKPIPAFIAQTSFFTYPFQYLVRQELGDMITDLAAAKKVLQNYGIGVEGDQVIPLGVYDFIHVVAITLTWFIIFNIVAYFCLSNIDYSVISYKKSMHAMNQTLDNAFGAMADIFCCGLGHKRRQRKKEQYVQKQIEQYQKRTKQEVQIQVPDTDELEPVIHDDAIPTPEVYLEFKNITYTVPIRNKETGVVEERELLRDNCGYVRPGEVIALMGPSGAGKSTLLDVLANKKSVGTITGDILLNGQKPDQYYNRCFGYVEQFDSHMSCLTVQEAISFSAKLRLPSDMSSKQKEKMVKKVMKQLELTPLANRRIGGPGDSNSISQEARKKVTIAVELVSNPGLLFLDEPTTGLDGGAAYAVMKTVRKLADEEKCSVICTIHQPSAEVFGLFDKILLLQAGGKMVYFDDIDKLEAYYNQHGFGKMEKGKNPADFAIEAIEDAQYLALSPNDIWTQSKEWKKIVHDLEENNIRPMDVTPLTFDSLYATSFFTQMGHLIRRSWKFFTRDTIGLIVRLTTGLFMGLMLGVLYWSINGREDMYKKNMFISILYVTVVYASESAAQEIPLLIYERAMFYREIDSKFYSITPYYIARTLAQFPLILAQTILFVATIYPMAYQSGPDTELQVKADGMFKYFIGVLAMLMTATTFSQMLAICTPNEGVGNVLYTTICTLCRMFGGFLIKLSIMAPWSRIVNGFNFFKYALFYFAGTQLVRSNDSNSGVNGNEIFGEFLKDQIIPFGSIRNEWVYYGGLCTFLLAFHLIGLLTLTFKRWDKR